MVAGLARKKKSQILHVDKLSDHLEALRRAGAALTAAVDRDASSYDAVMAAFKLPQGNPDETQKREDAIQTATKGAAEVPLGVARAAAELRERLVQLEAISPASMKSDLLVARLMAIAGANGALANVEINLDGLKDAAYVATTRAKVDELRKRLS
jgi:formiminotetrahydrofolate cyclodeaminase